MKSRLLPSLLLSLALASAGTAAAQEGLTPRSSLVLLDESCVHAPTPLRVDGEVIVVWMGGIRARRGPDLDSLGPVIQLSTELMRGIETVAGPGSFVVGYTPMNSPVRQVFYRRFGTDLAPLAPAVQLDSHNQSWRTPALAVDPGGVVTAVWGGSQTLKIRRFSAADLPLGPAVEIPLAVSAFVLGPSSLLVAWYDGVAPGVFRLSTRAYSLEGVPLGPAHPFPAGSGSDIDLAWTGSGFVVLRAEGDLYLQSLGPEGQPLGSERALGLDTWARFPQIAVTEDVAWIAWSTHPPFYEDPRFLSMVRADLATGDVSNPEVLERLQESLYATATRLEPDGDGVLVGWQVGVEPAILPTYCDPGLAVYARAFGPGRGTVDVPTLSSLGFASCALLFAAAAIGILLRRTV